MLYAKIAAFLPLLQAEGVLDESANLTLRAIERENGTGTVIFWTLFSIFALLLLAVIVISIWKAPDEFKSMFAKNPKGEADNLYLPVELHMNDPQRRVAGSMPPEKVYLRSLGFRRATILTEHPLEKGQEVWLSVKNLPYFHGTQDHIHALLVSSRKLGEHWFISKAKIIHEGREADEELSGFIRDLRAVPG